MAACGLAPRDEDRGRDRCTSCSGRAGACALREGGVCRTSAGALRNPLDAQQSSPQLSQDGSRQYAPLVARQLAGETPGACKCDDPQDTDLQAANFQVSKLKDASIKVAGLEGANLQTANLQAARETVIGSRPRRYASRFFAIAWTTIKCPTLPAVRALVCGSFGPWGCAYGELFNTMQTIPPLRRIPR